MRYFIAGVTALDPESHRDIEEHSPTDHRLDGLDAELREATPYLRRSSIDTSIQHTVMRDMTEGVDMGAHVPAGDNDLVRCGGAIASHFVAVAALEG